MGANFSSVENFINIRYNKNTPYGIGRGDKSCLKK
jgi:hypothetical protein